MGVSNIMRRWRQRRSTVADLADMHGAAIEALPIKQHTLKNRRIMLRHIVDHLGEMRMIDLRPSHIAAMVQAIHASGRRVTARRALIEMDALCYHAVTEGIIDSNPATPVKPLPSAPARSRLTWEEWSAIHGYVMTLPQRHSRPWFACAMRLALITGQRRSDLVRMRFDHIVGDHLRIEQYKTGARIALPLALRLDILGMSLGDVIQQCDDYRRSGSYLLRQSGGRPYDPSSLSMRFAQYRAEALPGITWAPKTPPTLHEIRSLSERLYRAQGIDTMTLLGHKRQHMTDQYNDDRGLSAGDWRQLRL